MSISWNQTSSQVASVRSTQSGMSLEGSTSSSGGASLFPGSSTQWTQTLSPHNGLDADSVPVQPSPIGTLGAGPVASGRPRIRLAASAVGAGKLVGADGEVAEDHRRVARVGAGDVAELAAHLRQLEEAPCALQGVLRLGQLARLEGGGQRVVGDRDGRGERALLLGRLGRRGSDAGERKHGKAGRQAEDPHR